MQQIALNQATAALRRIPILLVDDTDGKTFEAGITFSAGDIKVSKNGAAEANHAGSVTELGGHYYYEATAGEVDTEGYLYARFTKAGVRTFHAVVQVATAASAPPSAASIADAVWDEATAGHTTSGTFGEQCKTDIDAILDDTGTAGVVVASIATGAITAAAIATDAIGAAELAADAANEIADAIMVRASSNWEATAPVKSLGAAVMKLTHKLDSAAGTLTVKRSDGTTTHYTQTETTDAAAVPVIGLTGAV